MKLNPGIFKDNRESRFLIKLPLVLNIPDASLEATLIKLVRQHPQANSGDLLIRAIAHHLWTLHAKCRMGAASEPVPIYRRWWSKIVAFFRRVGQRVCLPI